MSDNIIEITDTNFETEVLKSATPALVDFSATWCAPCQMFHPTLAALADDYVGKAKICSVDVDKAQATAAKYQIRAVPTVMIFKNGKVEGAFQGVQPKDVIATALDAALQ